MMDYVLDKYNEGKLVIRAIDFPSLCRSDGAIKYDCSICANEVAMMANNEFDSVSSTLLIPNVAVKTYKNAGFLIDSSLATVQHIALTDSGSSGSFKNGDFFANNADFETIEQLANYISKNNYSVMNEVNLSIPLNSLIGLVMVKSNKNMQHLQRMLVFKKCIKQLMGIDLDIYEYDSIFGKLSKIELTDELLQEINSIENAPKNFIYYTDYSDEIYEGNIEYSKNISM